MRTERPRGMHSLRHAIAATILVVGLWSGSFALAGDSGYHLIKTIPLPGKGFWDYLSIDPSGRHIFVSHNNEVEVVNADTGALVATLPDMPGVHMIAVAADLGRGISSNGGNNTVTLIDLKTLKSLKQIAVGKGPDAIIYDPASHRAFTFNAGERSATAIDVAAGEVAGSIPLGGKPEFAAADGAGTVYVNIEDKSELVAFDSRALKVLHRWPLAPCKEPSGMAIDAAHERLFIGCHNKIMQVVNAKTGQAVATVPIGRGVDANRFDPGTGLAFSSNGGDPPWSPTHSGGTLTVAHEDTPDKYTVQNDVKTASGARTMEVDPQTHNVYLVTADFLPMAQPVGPPAEGRPPHFPEIVPGSFRLLVFAR